MSGRAKSTRQPRLLGHSFYSRPAIELAPALIGTILVRHTPEGIFSARIVETEAYVGPHDLAAHSSKGRTKRTEVMFGPAGHAYVFFIYGMYEMFNIVAAEVDDAQAVLVRAAEPLGDWQADLSGPGKLAREMRITRADNGRDLTGDELYLLPGPPAPIRVERSPRIGVDYAGAWKDELFRFFDADSRAVSKSRGRSNR
jgi:DNA-3-methyladenine glycosylase